MVVSMFVSESDIRSEVEFVECRRVICTLEETRATAAHPTERYLQSVDV